MAARTAERATPVRSALNPTSPLQAKVADGLSAVNTAHRRCLDAGVRTDFADSLDLDDALRAEHPEENRWDYLLGHKPSGEVIALEPHSAKSDQVSTVIAKRRAAMEQLAGHLRAGARVSRWLWVASGRIHFADTEKARRELDEKGIEFVGNQVLPRHLPPSG